MAWCLACLQIQIIRMKTSIRYLTESVRAVGGSMRVEHRIGDCRGGEHGGGDARVRNRRLHTLPGVLQLGGRDQANGRIDQPGWSYPHFPEARHDWVSHYHTNNNTSCTTIINLFAVFVVTLCAGSNASLFYSYGSAAGTGTNHSTRNS